MASPTPKPVSPFVKPTKKAVKATSPFVKTGQEKTADPWAPVLSFGQSVIDTLSTPLYGVEGFIAGAMDGKNPIAAAGENATAWTRGKRPITGSELLKKAGVEPNFWSSLAADVLLDPLTYTPGVVFSAPLKAASIAAKASVKAGKLAAKGEVAATKGVVGATATGFKEGFVNKPVQAWTGGNKNAIREITNASPEQKSFLAKYINKIDAAQGNVSKFTYRTVAAPEQRKLTQAANDTLASAFIAGKQAMIGTLLNEGAKRTLRKYSQQAARMSKKADKVAAKNLVEDATGQAIVQTPKVTSTILEDVTAKTTPEPATPATVSKQFKMDPIVDSAPTVREIKDAVKAADNTATVKTLKSILANVEKASKSAKVTAFADEDYVKEIRDVILSPKRDERVAQVAAIDKNIMLRIKDAVTRKDDASPFSVYDSLINSTLPEFLDLGAAIGKFRVAVDGKISTIAELTKQYGIIGKNIPKPAMDEAIRMFNRSFFELGNPNNLEKLRFEEISRLVGKDVAEQFKATGALNPTKKTNKDALESLLLSLPKKGSASEKKYSSFDDLIFGLTRGDQVDTESLLKVIRALDPEGKTEAQVTAAMGKDAYTGLSKLLTGDGVRTYLDAQSRINKADPEAMFKGTGVASSDAAAVYMAARANNELPPIPAAVEETRQAAALSLARWNENGLGKQVRDAAGYLSRAFDNNFEYIGDLKYTGVSLRGDVIARNTTGKKMAGTRAARKLETNENFQTKVAGSMFGVGTSREVKGRAKAFETGAEIPTVDRLDDLVSMFNMADTTLLATVGTRFMVKQQAKLLKKGEPAHYIFLHVGDFAAAAKKYGGTFEEYANKALFPKFPDGLKTDGISIVGLLEAMRMVAHGVEKNLMPTHEELVAVLASRGENQGKWSKDFTRNMPVYADKLATELENPAVIKDFLATHGNRLMGDIEDSLQPAQTMRADIFEAMFKAWRANNDTGINSTADRMDLVRNFFNEYAYASDIFNQTWGPAAEAVFKSAAMMFVKDGKVGGITKAEILPIDEVEWEAFRTNLNNYFKTVNPKAAAPAGREHLPFPTDAKKAEAQLELTDAEKLYAAHVDSVTTLTTKAEIKTWGQTFIKLQKKLDTARENAWAAWLPTRHYRDGKWVATTRYNHAKALEAAEQNRVILTIEGPVDRGVSVADTKPKTPKGPKQSAKQQKANIEARDKSATKRGQELAEGARVEAADHALSKADEIQAQHPDDPAAAGQRLLQEDAAKPILEADIPVFWAIGSMKALKSVVGKENGRSFLQKMGERTSATFGRRESVQVANNMESTMMNAVQKLSDYAHAIRDKYVDLLTPEQVDQAFTYAKADMPAPTKMGPAMAELVDDLTRMLKPIQEEYSTTTIPNEVLDRAFRRLDLTEKNGFLAPSKTPNKDTMLDNTPFGEMPESIADDTELARSWNERKAALKEQGMDPFIMLTRYAQALQFAKTEVAIGQQFAVRFGHQAEGLTREQAIKQGYVKLKTTPGSGVDLSIGIPADTLFHPYYAQQFGAMNRHWSGLYGDDAQMRQWLRVVLDLTGMFKATQTILRPGHHVTNAVGDTSSAILAGVRNPADWARAMNLALSHAGEDIASSWGKNKIDTKYKQLFRSLQGVGGRAYKETDETSALSVSIGGKKVSYSNEELTKMLEDNNVLINNIFVNDTQGLYESVLETGGKTSDEPVKELNKLAAENLKKGWDKARGKYQQVIKPAGDFASYYGNIPRTAHALHIMRSRNFNSVDEMLGAVNDAINRYHPTIQSLSSWERKYPRAIFTYYTWLRVAHNAMIDMAMNHTAAMTFVPKLQYQQAQQQGFEPTSFGQPWGEKRTTPAYINYSVYGPTYNGPRGAMMWKPAILPMDVLDNYQLSYDPAYSMDENAAKNATALGRGFIGKNLNLLAQPALEGLTGANPATGKPSQVKDAQTFMDKLFSMTGFYGIAKATGAYTPPNKGQDSTNPLTQRDRDLLMQNWLLGLKQSDVYTPANIGNAQSEQTARYNAWMQQYMDQNK